MKEIKPIIVGSQSESGSEPNLVPGLAPGVEPAFRKPLSAIRTVNPR